MTPTSDRPSNRLSRTVALCLALAALCGSAYYEVGTLPFLAWDDQVYVTENEQVKQGLTWESFRWAWTTEQAHNRHPLTWLSHMIDCHLFGSESATGHHLVNLAFHIANTVLLFIIWNLMTRQLWPAVLMAALFAVHPLNVESVAWVAERKNVLSTFFWLLTMGSYYFYALQPSWPRYSAVAVLFALGLMSKQMLVSLPCVLLLLDVWPLERTGGSLSGKQRPAWLVRVIEKLPLAVLSIAASVAVLNVQEVAKATLQDLPLSQRLANAAVSYVGYLQHAIWPSDLSVLYLHPRASLPPSTVIISLLVLLSITWTVLYPLRRYRYFAVGWLWYLGTLVPVIGLVQVGEQAMADRYTYIPLIGIWLIIAYGLSDLVRWRPYLRGWVTATAIVVVLALTIATQQQTRLWSGMLPLWNNVLAVDPSNYRAHLQVAMELRREDRLQEALPLFKMAAQLEPQRTELHIELAELQILLGNFEAAEEAIETALIIDPNNAVAHYWRGVLLVNAGDVDRGISELRVAQELLRSRDPLDQSGSAFEADILYNLAVAELRRGQYVSAIDCLTEARRINPGDDETANALALAHYRLATEQLERDSHFAVSHLRAALEARPDWIEASASLAKMLAMHPDETVRNGTEALRLATLVCQATNFESPAALELLAAAYAELGDFDRALNTARQAVELARQQNKSEILDQLERAIEHYQRKEPLRKSWAS